MRRLTALLGPAALFLSACGGAAPPSAPAAHAPSLRAEETYASVDDAERGLKQAQTELHAALGPGDLAGAPPRAEEAPPAEPSRGAPTTAPAPATAPSREAQAQEVAPCATACRAFTSMTRAADTICRLAGSGDERCSRAQRSIEEARSSLRTCVCVTAP